MSQLLSILDYYVNNETEKEDEVKQPVAANNNNTSAPASNTQITHVYPSLFSMWNPFPTINHHHHHHYSVNSNDNKDHKDDGSKNNTLLGTIIGLATAVAGYFSAGAWSKYNRVTEDLRKCEEINMRNLSTVGRQTEKLLTLYLLNRRWSLFNQAGIFVSLGGMTIGLLYQEANVIVPIAWSLLLILVISSGFRCGVWNSKQAQLQREMKGIVKELKTQQDRPPSYFVPK
jgi:hypothetical protein